MLNVFNVLIVVVVVAVAPVCCRIMDRCTLAQEMANLGVSFADLAKWTCIAKHESAYRTDIVGGSDNYGIFQINTHWCKPSNGRYSRNVCSLNCSDLLTDDIAGSVQCAQKIFNIRGWQAWSASAFCSSARQLSSIEECFVK